MIKKILKNFLPMPARSFTLYINAIIDKINILLYQMNLTEKKSSDNFLLIKKEQQNQYLELTDKLIELNNKNLHKLDHSLNNHFNNIGSIINNISNDKTEINKIYETLLIVNKIIETNSSNSIKIDSIINSITKLINNNELIFNEINKTNLSLQTYNSEHRLKTYLYYSPLEYNYYKSEFEEGLFNLNNLEIKFQKLILNLDSDSINIIIKILKRINLIYKFNCNPINLFTIKEQELIIKMNDEFKENIIQFNNTLSFYNKYYLPKNVFESGVFYYHHGIEHINNLNKLRNNDIIDAGAFIGDSALILSPLTNKMVYSFEPSDENFELLKQTIMLNNLKNTKPVPLLLGNKKERVNFNILGSSSSIISHSSFKYFERKEINSISLDEFVDENDLNVGLIKTDLEGSEQIFLEGAIRTIKKFKPILLMSIYHSVDDFFNIKPMIEALDLGYKFKIFKPSN